MNTTFQIATSYAAVECSHCAVAFALTRDFHAERLKDHRTFHCPNGCKQYYPQESTEEQLRRERDTEHEKNHGLQFRLEHANRSRAALKGQVTKIKRRVGKGVCPCCQQQFANLKGHMESNHPDWSEES